MQLTEKQEQGLIEAVNRYRNNEKYTVIAGYAGSGKSTLVKFIISALANEFNIDPDNDVCYTSFTGKATLVLQQKGNTNVSTLHKLLYESIPKESGGYIRKPIPVGKIDYKVIVVDEVSMVPVTLVELLMRHGIYTIYLGDPFQLPPVKDNEDNRLLYNPHIFLDEIMRQAQESEIIRLTMKIRAGEPIDYFSGKEVKVMSKHELNTGMLEWADQVLCATNAQRHEINNQMRKTRGFNGPPQEGEKVICLRNYWETFDSIGNALVNGTVGYLNNVFELRNKLPYFVHPNVPFVDIVRGELFISESGTKFEGIETDKKMFETSTPTLDWKTNYRLARSQKTKHLVPMEFAYGYCITCHKAQGSQWDQVLVIEEGFPFEKEEHAKWLYTACTRAVDKLVLLR